MTYVLIQCLDNMSAHISSTVDFEPNGMTSEGYGSKTFQPRDIVSAIRYGP